MKGVLVYGILVEYRKGKVGVYVEREMGEDKRKYYFLGGF